MSDMKKFSFAKYNGKSIVLLERQWATAWIAQEVTKTGLLKSIDHYVFEQDIDELIEPIMNIKDKELERMKIYHNNFVQYYESLKQNK
jgi:hypothetical protein